MIQNIAKHSFIMLARKTRRPFFRKNTKNSGVFVPREKKRSSALGPVSIFDEQEQVERVRGRKILFSRKVNKFIPARYVEPSDRKMRLVPFVQKQATIPVSNSGAFHKAQSAEENSSNFSKHQNFRNRTPLLRKIKNDTSWRNSHISSSFAVKENQKENTRKNSFMPTHQKGLGFSFPSVGSCFSKKASFVRVDKMSRKSFLSSHKKYSDKGIGLEKKKQGFNVVPPLNCHSANNQVYQADHTSSLRKATQVQESVHEPLVRASPPAYMQGKLGDVLASTKESRLRARRVSGAFDEIAHMQYPGRSVGAG